ncbi:hypothetical protein NQZ68_001359 [Dissostichus eleginoides]|nr:hypothetical protein NQZ68_001359 [Dissostichus eleginoides]
MDKGALLMLLCLQAFLLITTLPSSEAAALLREDLTPPDPRLDLTALERLKIRQRFRRRSGCWGRPGACSAWLKQKVVKGQRPQPFLPSTAGCFGQTHL